MTDREAAAIYRSLAPRVLGYLRSQGVDDPEALCGDVFVGVARDLGRFEGDDDALRSWVFSIAHNRVVDASRRRARRPAEAGREVVDGDLDPVAPPAEPTDPALLAALAELTDEQREVLGLRFVADLSIEQVAELTGRSLGAVKAMQHRALDRLRSLLGDDPYPHGPA